MDISTNINTEYIPGVLLEPFRLNKGVTKNGIDIVFPDENYSDLYNMIENCGNANIIDYQCVSEYNMAEYTRAALDRLPKKNYIVVSYLSEALNSVYWNVVLEIIKSYGYKKVIWIDGGLTPGYLFSHLSNLKVVHKTSNMFFEVLHSNFTGHPSEPSTTKKRTYYFLSLGRLARRERIYFTKKILDNDELKTKGIYSCGWGDHSVHTIWNKNNTYDRENLLLFLNESDIENFPVSLGHQDRQQHHMMEKFDEAVINVVQESSAGFDHRSHEHVYSSSGAPAWCRVNSDRLFFTEKSAKAFLTSQFPLFIAAPGYVNQLRILGFDLFDDIIDHSYDKEDNIYKRCDMVFGELQRLINLYTLEGWNNLIRNKCTHRFHRNFMLLKDLNDDGKLAKWINSQLV
jgi:hypothetical protein